MGSRLLNAAEVEARTRGCTQMIVSSHSFQAPGFYQRSGYVEYGRIECYPHGHAEVHLVKNLQAVYRRDSQDGVESVPRARRLSQLPRSAERVVWASQNVVVDMGSETRDIQNMTMSRARIPLSITTTGYVSK